MKLRKISILTTPATANDSKYSRMDQVKLVEDRLKKFCLVHSWILCPKYGNTIFSFNLSFN